MSMFSPMMASAWPACDRGSSRLSATPIAWRTSGGRLVEVWMRSSSIDSRKNCIGTSFGSGRPAAAPEYSLAHQRRRRILAFLTHVILSEAKNLAVSARGKVREEPRSECDHLRLTPASHNAKILHADRQPESDQRGDRQARRMGRIPQRMV